MSNVCDEKMFYARYLMKIPGAEVQALFMKRLKSLKNNKN
jgi:hypothetical protein